MKVAEIRPQNTY